MRVLIIIFLTSLDTYIRFILLLFIILKGFVLYYSNMKFTTDSNNITEKEFLKLFVEVYSLPKFSDYIKNTTFDSQQRTGKITELENRISYLFHRFNKDPNPYINQFTAQSYLKAQRVLREKMVEHYEKLYPNSTSFKIVNQINDKLNDKHQMQCQRFLGDLIKHNRQMQVKRYVEDVIERKFKFYDLDGSGSININELQKRLSNLGLPISMAQQIMTRADTQKDGVISFKQFREYTQHQIIKHHKHFYNLDSDNDYKLNYLQTKQSLYQIFPGVKMGSVFDQIFRMMDQDGSGLINFQQWCEFLIIFPRTNFNAMINQWAMYATTMIDPQQSSSFLNRDLLKSTKTKDGKRILSYWDIIRTLIFGAIAGGISRTITAPLQRLKVLYQTMYTETKCPSIAAGLKESYLKGGLIALFKGNSISIFLNCLQQSLRFTIIEYSKKSYEIRGDKIRPLQFLKIGIVTGVISSLVLFPFDVLRIRFITSEDISVIHQAKQIYQKSGPRGFYSGLTPYLISVLPAGSFNVMSYNTLRGLLLTDKDIQHPNIYKFMFIGGFGALITNTVIYPLSLITSRLIVANKQIEMWKDKIKMHQMIKKIYSHEGLSGFYKGWSASTLRVFIGQSFNFGTYETLKALWTMKNNYFNPQKKKY